MPTGHFRHYLEHYLAPHPSQEVREMFWSTAILDFAAAAIMVFEPVYLYTLGFTIPHILYFYAAVYVLYLVLLPIGGRICREHGFEHTILWSSPFLIIYYLSFFAIRYNQAFIAIAVIALVIQKILYWPGYHSNFATWSGGEETGREISNLYALVAFATALAPMVGGLIIQRGGYRTLFIVVAVMILLSNVPLLKTPEIFEPRKFPYFQAIKRLVSRRNRRQLLAFIGFGEELIALVLWPIYINTVLPDPVKLGAVISLAMLATVLVTLYVGRLVDEGGRMQVLRNGAMFVAGSWVLRLLANGGLGVFLMDAFYRVAKNMVGVPMTAIVYDGARRNAATEEIVFFEMALSIGKILAALIAALLFTWLPMPWAGVFILSAIFAAMYSAVRSGGDGVG